MITFFLLADKGSVSMFCFGLPFGAILHRLTYTHTHALLSFRKRRLSESLIGVVSEQAKFKFKLVPLFEQKFVLSFMSVCLWQNPARICIPIYMNLFDQIRFSFKLLITI
uniref:(northern house mosquito) hypothetical protein n=1 Tax=Culex pipiens TaxID=7175 RepID=A0A8D8DLL7_CULPI